MQKKNSSQTIFTIGIVAACGLFLSVFTGCYYDNEEDLYPGQNCDTSDVRFSNVIVPILDNACMQCHSNAQAPTAGNGISFEGHANLIAYLNVAEETFLGAVRHEPGYPQMPKNGNKLSNCDIRKIEIWIENGKLNN